PANLISPVSKAILAMIPMPNRPSTAGSSSLNNYAFASSSNQDNFRFGVRLDHNINDRQRLNFRVATFSTDQSSSPTMDTPLYTSNVTQSHGGKSGNLNYSWTASPTVLLDLRASTTFTPLLTRASHGAGFNNSFLPSIY